MDVIEILGLIGITLMIVEYAEPIQLLKRYYQVDDNSEPKQIHKRIIKGLTNCALCTGFWVGLLSLSIYKAVIIAFLAEVTYTLLERFFNKLK